MCFNIDCIILVLPCKETLVYTHDTLFTISTFYRNLAIKIYKIKKVKKSQF